MEDEYSDERAYKIECIKECVNFLYEDVHRYVEEKSINIDSYDLDELIRFIMNKGIINCFNIMLANKRDEYQNVINEIEANV